nr:cycloartenol-C-24-methyltransferase 1-like isoform X2 [Oryza sativa Japonica Group]
MSKTSALDLASGLGGKIRKEQVKSAVDQYENYHEIYGGEVESRTSNYADLANKYYDLVTSFYEYGWGESFHFGSRWQGETLRESLKRHEHFLALQLGLKKGMKVLDVGCGIGGPLREIARFSSASVTGLNNNAYQISRGKELNFSVGLSETCNFVKVGVYREICRVLKPGQLFALDEWCMTDKYDPGNSRHRSIKAEIELGNGLPDIRTTKQCIQALKDAGFEVVSVKDLAEDSPLPWYLPLDSSQFSLNGFRLTRVGRFITHMLVKTLECLHVAPQGSLRVSSFLETAAEGLVKGAKEGIFTPIFFVLARKPLDKQPEI